MLARIFEDKEPEEILAWALERFGDKLALVTSFQREGMVILDMAAKIDPNVRVITIDTGRLHEETYTFIHQIRKHYNINIEVQFPNSDEVRQLVSEHGVNLFYNDVDSRLACCHVRKVNPLVHLLARLDAWIVGLRRGQAATRSNIKKIEVDYDHGEIIKLNPLADWTHDRVLQYIKRNDVPQHPLYQRGYASIGCAPCTRPIQMGEDIRSGRWWWEKNVRKECGMHCRI